MRTGSGQTMELCRVAIAFRLFYCYNIPNLIAMGYLNSRISKAFCLLFVKGFFFNFNFYFYLHYPWSLYMWVSHRINHARDHIHKSVASYKGFLIYNCRKLVSCKSLSSISFDYLYHVCIRKTHVPCFQRGIAPYPLSSQPDYRVDLVFT